MRRRADCTGSIAAPGSGPSSPNPSVQRTATPMSTAKQAAPKLTVVLDLDETLVHVVSDPAGSSYESAFEVRCNDALGDEVAFWVNPRPGVERFLTSLNCDAFDVYLFTASQASCACR
jgi:TFIIF-interacting CTD phosphatase-like protein